MRLIDATRIEQYILNNCSDNEEINAIYAEIINAPTIALHHVEIKHGHWVGDFCSECGKDALCDCDKYEIYGTIHSDYCPHCGAKMDEVENV